MEFLEVIYVERTHFTLNEHFFSKNLFENIKIMKVCHTQNHLGSNNFFNNFFAKEMNVCKKDTFHIEKHDFPSFSSKKQQNNENVLVPINKKHK
jgi:hypothetical protein